MSATKSGVTADQQRIAVAKKMIDQASFMLSDKGVFTPEVLLGLDQHIQGIVDGFGIKVEVMKPNTIAAFLTLGNRTEGMFNQLASELNFWTLLDQLEETCFLNPQNLAMLRPFIAGLYQDEVSKEQHFQPPAGFAYLPVEEAVSACQAWMRKIFGSSTVLNAATTLKLAKEAKAGKGTEGIPIWIKLRTLCRLMGIKGDPLTITDEGREAYAGTLDRFVPEVGKAFIKVYTDHGFTNHRQGRLSAQHAILTPAGITTWQRLEQLTDDDFCFAPGGADTGKSYSGHSVRLARVKTMLAEIKFPQDGIMTGTTVGIQPSRMCQFEHLGADCAANAYTPDADGQFSYSLYWYWSDGELHFGGSWAGHAAQRFGSASGRLS
jgi:hypothetical protein